jgi:hypothetical protein
MDPSPQDNQAAIRPGAEPAGKANRRWLSFRLMDLLLVPTLVAAWLPYFLATRQFESLEAENAALRRMAEMMLVEDPSKIHVLKVRSNRYGAAEWKVFVPEWSNYELRFATEQISSLAFPREFERFPLTSGEHRISMIHKRSSEGHQFQLFVDQKPVILRNHGPEWIDYSSSSSTSTGTDVKQFAVGKPVKLKQEWFEEELSGFPHSHGHTWEEVSNKGSVAWIAPAKMVHPPPPIFVSPKILKGVGNEWGFREGIRIRFGRFFPRKPLWGTIQIVHTGTRLPKNLPLNELAIKPRADDRYANSTTEQRTQAGGKLGLRFATSDSKQLSKKVWEPAEGVLSEDGKTLRLFVHPEPFSNRARPVIEIRFDAPHANRIGFRVHTASESTGMTECVLSAMSGSFADLRQLHFADGHVKTTKQMFESWPDESKLTDKERSPWQTFSGEQFPLVDDGTLRQIRLTSDVSDYSTLKYAGAVSTGWQYKALPSEQSWLCAAETPFTVALRARKSFRNGNGPIPGGPAFEDFELRTRLQPNQWIWYEVLPKTGKK